ncbi:MAG: hypothetical protein CXR30_02975 [Geobacter sp.]|nr:MAG: hypothetical protein CXR30_02975 [Geobacter sp.]
MEKKLKQRVPGSTRHVIGECPVCGADVYAGMNVYHCANNQDDSCDFRLYANCLARLGKQKITVEEMKVLLTKKPILLEGLVKNDGEVFNCDGALRNHREWGWGVRLFPARRILRSSPNLPPGFGKIGERRKKPKGE